MLVKKLSNKEQVVVKFAEKKTLIFLMSTGGKKKEKMEEDIRLITVYVFVVNVTAYSMVKNLK